MMYVYIILNTKDYMFDAKEYFRRLLVIKEHDLLSCTELQRAMNLSATSFGRFINIRPEYKFNPATLRKLRDYVDLHYKESMEGK